jgi:hypothetical protein
MNVRRLKRWDIVLLVVIVTAALVLRVAWLRQAGAAPAQAQWEDPQVVAYAKHLAEHGRFGGPVPLQADESEHSAALSPGYPFFVSQFYRGVDAASGELEPAERDRRARLALAVAQALLGAVTAGLVFLIAYRVFDSRIVALLAGALAVVHYLWIAGTGQIADGVLAAFLFAVTLHAGLRVAESAETGTAALFGISLGLLLLVRASLVLFALVALFWVISKLQDHPRASLATLVMLVAVFATPGLWLWRNYKLFGAFVPITSRGGFDLWMGNSDAATGGALARGPTGPYGRFDARFEELSDRDDLVKLPEPLRSLEMAKKAVWRPDGWIWSNVGRFLRLRGAAALYFGTGQRFWIDEKAVELEPNPEIPDESLAQADVSGDESASLRTLASTTAAAAPELPPYDARSKWTVILLWAGFVVGLFRSHRWRENQGMLIWGLFAAALPVIATHAGLLHGPRLPVDVVLLVYCAFAAASFIPGWYRWLLVSSGFRGA